MKVKFDFLRFKTKANLHCECVASFMTLWHSKKMSEKSESWHSQVMLIWGQTRQSEQKPKLLFLHKKRLQFTHIKSAADTIFANFYLWAGNRHEYFKVRDGESFEKESLIRLCRERFCAIYLCMLFARRLLSQKKHNFNTNLFMFCCCRMSSLINLWAFLNLQSTSLVAFFVIAGLRNLEVRDLVRVHDTSFSSFRAICTSIYTQNTILTRCVMSMKRNDVRIQDDIHFRFVNAIGNMVSREAEDVCRVSENCELLWMIFNYR